MMGPDGSQHGGGSVCTASTTVSARKHAMSYDSKQGT